VTAALGVTPLEFLALPNGVDLKAFRLASGKASTEIAQQTQVSSATYCAGSPADRGRPEMQNTKTLHTGRVLEKFPTIVARLAGMVDRFTSMLDCVDVAFLPDGILDQLPTPSQIGATRTGGLDINKPRTRAALAAVLALAVSPDGFTVADLAAKVQSLTGQSKDDYTVRQAAYDLRKLRGKHLVVKPGRTRRYHVPGQGARTIAALLALRDQVIAPILAGVRRPGPGRPLSTRTRIDRDYENLRAGMRTLFHDLAINAAA